LKYQDWVALFGRSLQTPLQNSFLGSHPEVKRSFHEKLCSIATASECGMFSSDVHQTVVKSSPVLLDIVRGVEDFAYSSFVSSLMDWE
ncbi:unnamed protein product, partial [Allacma fusca]